MPETPPPGGDAVARKIRQDPFARRLGMEYLEIRPGRARVAMPVTPELLNFHGIPHGGALFSLADAAFAAASNAHGEAAVALSMTIHFLAAAPVGARLVAEAEELRQGRRAGFYQIHIRTEAGDLLAVCQAVVHRKSASLVPGGGDPARAKSPGA